MCGKYDNKTPEGSIRSYLLAQGFLLDSFTCSIHEQNNHFYMEHEADISLNQSVYQVNPSIYDKTTQTYLDNFIVTKIKKKKYQVKYFGEG